jgi:2-polyprenyl-3-methyl-5-hydroxy-6-metoxy-1,4-benzoquinol methylase
MSGEKFWNRMAKRYISGPIPDQAIYDEKLARARACFTPETTVFEFGCGSGMTARKHAPHVKSITAIDYSEAMIAHARDAAKAEGITNVSFETASLENWPDTQSFDVVMGMSILHLLPDRPKALQKIVTLLKPGGLFISSTVCLGPNSLLRPLIALPSALGLLPKVGFLTPDQLKAEMTTAGLTILTHWQPKPKSAQLIIAMKPGDQANVIKPKA